MGLKVDCNKKQNFEVHKKLHFEQKTKANLERESKFDSSIIEIQKRAKRSSPHPKKKSTTFTEMKPKDSQTQKAETHKKECDIK